ncbi:unnamed protein product [Closterium sp. NIES-53]
MCRAALQLLALPAPPPPPTLRALLQPARRALLLRASRPDAARTSRPAALRIAPCCSQRVAPYCSQPPPSRPAATAAAAAAAARATAAAARATATASGGAARSAGSAASAGGARGATGSVGGAAGAGRATGSAGGAAGAGGAGPTTDRHCLSWPLSRQLQRLGVDSGSYCLSRTTPPLRRFASGFFSEPVQVVEALAAALGASECAAALGASESTAPLGARASPATSPSSAEALHTFTLYTGTSRCFFHDCTIITPLAAPVPVSLADPTGGPVVARASTFLPCPAVPSGSLSGLHLSTFSTNLVSNAAIQDRLARVGYSPTRLSSGTTASVTPPYRVSAVCTPVSLSLAFPGPCPPSRARLPDCAFPALRGGIAPPLTSPSLQRSSGRRKLGGVRSVALPPFYAGKAQLGRRAREGGQGPEKARNKETRVHAAEMRQ